MSKIAIPLHTYLLSYSEDDMNSYDVSHDFNLLENIYLFTFSRFKKILQDQNIINNLILNVKTEKKYKEFFLYGMANIYIDMKKFLQRKDHAFYFWIYDNKKIGIVSFIEKENLIVINDALVYSKYKGYKDEHFTDFCLGLCSYNKTVVFPDDIMTVEHNSSLLNRTIVLKESKIDFNTENDNDIKLCNIFTIFDNYFYFIMNHKEEYSQDIHNIITDKNILNNDNRIEISNISLMEKTRRNCLKELLNDDKKLIKDLNRYYYIPDYLKGKLR